MIKEKIKSRALTNCPPEYICLRQSFADLTVSSVGSEPKETVFRFDPIDFRPGSLIILLRRPTADRTGLGSSLKTSEPTKEIDLKKDIYTVKFKNIQNLILRKNLPLFLYLK